MSLFVNDSFISHSGKELPFKIDCDGLSEEDIETIASIIGNRLTFRDVVGVPEGGLRLASALVRYCFSEGPILIIDDVLTTGASMEEKRKEVGENSVGVVIFARGWCPNWVRPIFHLSGWAQ